MIAAGAPPVAASGGMGTVKIMFASLGAYGHLYPMMPLAPISGLQRVQRCRTGMAVRTPCAP
jgi:hypothetical protein